MDFTLTDATGYSAPSWIQIVSETRLELSPSDLGLVGSYSFHLSAREAISNEFTPVAVFDVTLKDPCVTAKITPVTSISD